MDVLDRAELGFPKSLPEFQEFFPDDAACASYLEKARWPNGFTRPHGQKACEPSRIKARPTVLTCRKCRRQSALMSGTVMERSHTRLSTWFWAAYLVTSQTNGMSAAQFQRQLGRQDHRLGVVAVDVQHRRFNHFDDIGAKNRGAHIARV